MSGQSVNGCGPRSARYVQRLWTWLGTFPLCSACRGAKGSSVPHAYGIFNNEPVCPDPIRIEEPHREAPALPIIGSDEIDFDLVDGSDRLAPLSPHITTSTPAKPSLVIRRHDLQLTKVLGRGQFGMIVSGHLRRNDLQSFPPPSQQQQQQSLSHGEHLVYHQPVVVRVLKEEATLREQSQFLNDPQVEPVVHPNVLQCLGVASDQIPYLTLFEFCSKGDLKSFMNHNLGLVQTLAENDGLLLKFSQNIVSGMAKLMGERMDLVPWDLGARCCQVSTDLSVKIGDYGYASMIHCDDYIPTCGHSLPIRWFPPETLVSLRDKLNSSPTETVSSVLGPNSGRSIWTLAMTLWEITHLCQLKPYEDILPSDSSFLDRVESHADILISPTRIKVAGVDVDAIESVIQLCMKENPNDRPECHRLDQYLTDIYQCFQMNRSS
ncbi:serine/threonine-protein kinase LMTK2-like [Tigriopus californicus]|uniref:serine/threonine-protein kinase LMTK2-like n=1 Tax=Tigriopus californicus TaxID=6832 RepID=UPI0027DAAEAC|nr:serine/threonine-protein kinase LMTK2-like [Tigriopus californicus]|eukprot:TCALIF_03880-PA protein Name:"Similar to Lmtk2 Serine/threonine-protein kinase LMTK2 (Mus musculus)" AED:0.05 eAED:0.05 QI:49/0.75/0.6/1/0.75/0.8/5/62/435